MELPSCNIVSFLDDWSIATIATDGSDIANLADADHVLDNPSRVIYQALIWDFSDTIPVLMEGICDNTPHFV